MLKQKIASLEGVPEKFHSLYTENDDGIFVLDEEFGIDDSGLKKNSEKLLQEKRALAQEKLDLQERLAALESKNQTAAEEGMAAKGEYEKLLEIKEQQFQTQLEAANSKAEKAVESLKTTLVGAELQTLANELAGDKAALLMPHLQNRVTVNEVDGEYKIQYTDENGNPTSQTSALLIEEFKGNELYAPILKGRQSSGGGSAGGTGGNGAIGSEYETAFTPGHKDYSPSRQGELQEKDPQAYAALSKKHNLDDPYTIQIPQAGRTVRR